MERYRALVSAARSAPSSAPSPVPSLLDERFDRDSCGSVPPRSMRPLHEILAQALTALGRLAHRGATAADGKAVTRVGVLAAVPRNLWSIDEYRSSQDRILASEWSSFEG
jgi:glutamate synthase (NADPH/NADH) large chain